MAEDAVPVYVPDSRPDDIAPCTYSLGYKRQDVYSCTQCSEPGKISGFCSGCKTACHGDHLHAVTDLYSKRWFRCDCGNDRMKNCCQLNPTKAPENQDNLPVYNHNFNGLYCRCGRGYDLSLGDMLQCAICEDWFHEVCLRTTDSTPTRKTRVKLESINCELVCCTCADKLPFLDDYFAKIGLFQPHEDIQMLQPQPPRSSGCSRPPTVEHRLLDGKDRLWPAGYRLKLCKCAECKIEYRRLKVPYITDRNDLVNLTGIPEEDLLSKAPGTVQEVLKGSGIPPVPTTPTKKKKKAATKKRTSASNTPTRSRKKKATTPTPTPTRSPARNSGRTRSVPTTPTRNGNGNSKAGYTTPSRATPTRNQVPMLRDADEVDMDEDEDEDMNDANDDDYNLPGDNNNNNVDEDEDDDEDDELEVCSSPERDEMRWKREPLPVVELTDDERDRIHAGVSSFINNALAKEGGGNNMADGKMLKKYLEKLRDDILNGHTGDTSI